MNIKPLLLISSSALMLSAYAECSFARDGYFSLDTEYTHQELTTMITNGYPPKTMPAETVVDKKRDFLDCIHKLNEFEKDTHNKNYVLRRTINTPQVFEVNMWAKDMLIVARCEKGRSYSRQIITNSKYEYNSRRYR